MEIIERLMYIMKLNNLSPSAFADKINVQRSSVSHLLSGRNKPSLELIQKVIFAFPKVNADWLISGKQIQNEPLIPIAETPKPASESSVLNSPPPLPQPSKEKAIQKIVVFYSDNSFEEFLK
ncbi:MAG: helix-turn-helix transcriptional regulator [Flavobacteriales bacterium]|nr:helix-turn-helix transcriptional regulator [Flavobacteriales bacterium]